MSNVIKKSSNNDSYANRKCSTHKSWLLRTNRHFLSPSTSMPIHSTSAIPYQVVMVTDFAHRIILKIDPFLNGRWKYTVTKYTVAKRIKC